MPPAGNSFKRTLDGFKSWLIEQALEQGKTVVLIVDEAQTLGYPQLELLRQLMNVESDEAKLLQVVLFAQDELRTKLSHTRGRNLRSRIVLASTLERLSGEEIADALAFRWSVASGGKQHPFSPEALAALYEYSDGILREATILADNVLQWGYYNRQALIDRPTVEAVAADRQRSLGGKRRVEVGDGA